MTAQLSSVKIPGYQLEQVLGQGAMATVFLASQISLHRRVALKVMSSALGVDDSFRTRFLREGRIVGRLTHPHIVAIYDVGVTDEQQYIAMEWISNGSLKQHLVAAMAPGKALDIIRQLAEALAFAHDQNIVHRDVKPENVLFRHDGAAVLTDFGIAKTIGEDATQLTRIDAMAGTPRYMSPEQISGGACDSRSDIYAMGVMLYEMLVGNPPFDGESSLAVLYAQVHDPVPRLPKLLQTYQPLLDAMLAKDPENRVPDCQMLLDFIAVAKACPALLSLPQSVSIGTATPAPFRRRFLKSMAAGLVALILMGYPGLQLVDLLPPLLSTTAVEPAGNDYDARRRDWPMASSEEQDAFVDDFTVSKKNTVSAAAISLQPRQAVLTPQRRMTREALMSTLKAQILSGRLHEPAGDNALNTLRIIRELKLGNKEITEQTRLLAMALLQRANLQFVGKQYEAVTRTVQLGLQADKQNTMLSKLGQQAQLVQQRNQLFVRAEKYVHQSGTMDTKSAFSMYQEAAKMGHLGAMAMVGVLYANGTGVQYDIGSAMNWLRKAANAGNHQAQYNLAMGLLFGGHRNTAEAAIWMKKAAVAKVVFSYRVLSWMYRTATGVESSLVQAFLWSTRNALSGIDLKIKSTTTVTAWERAFTAAQQRDSNRMGSAFDK